MLRLPGCIIPDFSTQVEDSPIVSLNRAGRSLQRLQAGHKKR
jgi:hypothetical protein